jgi:hypothetical protein
MLVFKLLRASQNGLHRVATSLHSIVTYLDGVAYVARNRAIDEAEAVAVAKMSKAAAKWYRAREAAEEAALVAQEYRDDLAVVGDAARWERDEAVRSL